MYAIQEQAKTRWGKPEKRGGRVETETKLYSESHRKIQFVDVRAA